MQNVRQMFRKKVQLDESLVRLDPHGSLLRLTSKERTRLHNDAISARLFRFMEQPKPFVAILIDLRGVSYTFSSADVATVVMSMRDDQRRRLLPCAIVATEKTAKHLRKVLELTQLVELEQLAIVESDEQALSHIHEHLGQHTA